MDNRPVLDTTSEFDINMIEGDPISFNWAIEGVDWSGAYTFKASTPGGLVELAATATASGSDTIFTVTSSANDLLTPTASGHQWSIKKDGAAGTTRFKGLLIVEAKVQ